MKIDPAFCESVGCKDSVQVHAEHIVCSIACEHHDPKRCIGQRCSLCELRDEMPRQCPYWLERLVQ